MQFIGCPQEKVFYKKWDIGVIKSEQKGKGQSRPHTTTSRSNLSTVKKKMNQNPPQKRHKFFQERARCNLAKMSPIP